LLLLYFYKIFIWFCLILFDVISLLGSSSSATASSGAASSGVEFIVPADEHFPRCPVSKEMFETFFDEDEGEMMFRNAAKVG
jgi:hypothetical protein